MKFILQIDCLSPAFGTTHEQRSAEVARILADVAKRTTTGKPGSVQHAGIEARAAYALDNNEQPTGRYWWEGVEVPEASPMVRALKAAGYYIADTGGGCKAWRKDFAEDGGERHALITDEDGCSLPEDGDKLVACFYPVWNHESTCDINTTDFAAAIAGLDKAAARPDTTERLTEELNVWQDAQGVAHESADDQVLDESLTHEQRLYLSRFIERWDVAQSTEDETAHRRAPPCARLSGRTEE